MTQCRSVDDFFLAEPVVKNLARINIDKLFPVQVWCRDRCRSQIASASNAS